MNEQQMFYRIPTGAQMLNCPPENQAYEFRTLAVPNKAIQALQNIKVEVIEKETPTEKKSHLSIVPP